MTSWRPFRDDDGPRPIADGLGGVARRLGMPAPDALRAVFARWADVVGPQIAAHARPRSLRDGVLVVEADDPAWASQLRWLAGELQARLAGAGEPGTVTRVEVRVRRHPRA